MKNITYLIAFLLTFNWGFGQEIASFSSAQNSGCSGTIASDANITTTGICRGSGIVENTGATYNSRQWTTSGSIDANDYLEWTLTPNSGYSIDLTTMDITYDRSGNGPRMVDIQVDTGSGFVSVFTDSTVLDVAGGEDNNGIDLSSITGITGTITFRLYAFNASTAGGTFDIEENTATNKGIIINGSVNTIPCSGSTTTWDGSSWDNGTPNLTTEAVLNADYNTTDEVSFSACSLTVNSGAILNIADNDYVEVHNDLTVNTGGEIIVQPYGAFIQNNDLGAVNNSGHIEVDKNTAILNNWYEYTYWSSPVRNTTVEDALSESEVSRRFIFNASEFNDALAETNNNNTYLPGQDGIDDEGNDWQWVSGTTPMTPGVGYAATHSEIGYISPSNYKYTFVGDFNNGEISVPVSRNDVTSADKNWNFIGNPYPSAISISAFLAQNMYPVGPLEGVVHFWSQNTNYSATANGNQALNFDTNDYAYYNGMGGTQGGDGTIPNGFIPSGQGFFISFSDSHPSSSGTVVFNNAMRSLSLLPDNSQFFKNTTKTKKEVSEANKLWVNLTSDNGVFNQILIGYVDGATNGYDGSYYDADKIVAPTAYAALYSSIEDSDKKFVIQGKAASSLNEEETIALGFKTNIDVPTLYTMSLADIQGDFLSGSPVYLKDNLLNKVHDLSVSDYTFTSEVGEFNERFVIGFSNSTLSTDTALTEASSLKIVALDNDYVQFSTSNDLQIKSVAIYDILGRVLYNFKGSNSSETYKLSNLKSPVFLAKVELSNGAIISKKAVKK
ncbi:hypothetical protein BWZ22_07740 [Seonamhaeicola sp. S2-3]|uniref:T9SS type A sorting domain-containing protein n=1 Tax=Seonamhaeicola sp. S2-3 TaxID=1936081 RepID=UPI0009727E4F|nr:T9SS type A sorting domain-containing protein [Seonamhaeicola sp. S2-3]APY11140.1 hypothetical protein BWZ22_07740 [Seonamhaeicola sp. S2-3]